MRQKVQMTPPPETWAEADALLAELAGHQREIDRVETELTERVAELKTQAKAAVASHQKDIADGEKRLALFAEIHREDFGKLKSRKLTHGSIGWRQSTTTKLLLGVAETVKRLVKLGLTECVREKAPEVDKEAVRQLPEKVRMELGVEVTAKDTFFWEPDVEELPNTAG